MPASLYDVGDRYVVRRVGRVNIGVWELLIIILVPLVLIAGAVIAIVAATRSKPAGSSALPACPTCGQLLSGSERFCPTCGTAR
jgi:hypothetical protein